MPLCCAGIVIDYGNLWHFFQALIADNFGILALFQVLIVDSFGILALLQVFIAENFGILALIQVLIADNFSIFNALGKINTIQGLNPWPPASLLTSLPTALPIPWK